MNTPTSDCRRAFSLVELLVVIAIIALLISILLPALAGARTASREILALANARTLAQTFGTYLNENDDTYPYISAASDPQLGGIDVTFVQWYPEGTLIGTDDRFMLSWAWPGPIASVAPWEQHYETWVSPGKDTRLPPSFDQRPEDAQAEEDISWRLSNTFLADPALFTDDATLTDEPWRAIRQTEVTFPTQKVLAWDTHLAYRTKRPELIDGHWNANTPMAFVDGHA
ncbi:MAG: prepilin-type N-terminal cleavage/methylation domain-containing protein, partial [Planctomycetota bacterium]